NRGDVEIDLDAGNAPITVNSFAFLARDGFYDGLTFHRVIPNFMIQGGDPLGEGIGGPGYDFDDEIHPDLYFNRPYLLAMANAGIRFGKGTNGSQFFVTVGPQPHLNGKHTIFGEVIEGKDVVDAIAKTPTQRDKPIDEVVLESVTIDRVQG
ncbi:MAG TPA: peptidylprolyl isomerase, partial [Nonomuraea sp.]|nr:peptidylprolyl isomerase [Nonomuraea sp.]